MLDCTRELLNNRQHMKLQTQQAPGRQRGFTLIELMIAVVIIAVLLAVALPSFMGSIRKGRRSEAIAALAAMQQAQERWRSNRAAYTTTLADLGVTSPTGPGGYYTLSILSGSATAYDLAADGSGSSQANDAQCAKLSIRVTGGSVTYASCSTCTTFATYAATDACWSR